MAKATLEFNLDDPEDRMEHLRCVMSTKLAITLWDIEQHLRTITKYAPDSTPKEVYDELCKVREQFYEIMNDNGIHLDELMN